MKNKVIKECPRCKIKTQKNEGCNHMTCTECKYQWCWLCEGEYHYGHLAEENAKDYDLLMQIHLLKYLGEEEEDIQIVIMLKMMIVYINVFYIISAI